MEIVLLFLLYAATTLGSTILSKLCSNTVPGAHRGKYLLYFITFSSVACLFFLLFSGFRITINLPTLLFSLIYALVVLGSVFASLHVYRYAPIPTVTIVLNTASMLLTPLLGRLLFGETITPDRLVRAGIIIVAAVLIFFDTRKRELLSDPDPDAPKGTPTPVGDRRRRLLLLCLFLGLQISVTLANSVVMKLYTTAEGVADENSFFFLTNAILVLGAVALLAFDLLRKTTTLSEIGAILKARNLCLWSGSVVCNNLGSLLSIWLIARMDISLYTPLTAALAVIVALVASLLFRERLTRYAYLAVAVACVALVI